MGLGGSAQFRGLANSGFDSRGGDANEHDLGGRSSKRGLGGRFGFRGALGSDVDLGDARLGGCPHFCFDVKSLKPLRSTLR